MYKYFSDGLKERHMVFFVLLSFFLNITFICFAQQAKTGFIKAGNMDVYYERVGKGEAIILLHAGLQDHTMWQSQVKELSTHYKVITPDLPFHGKTNGNDTTLLAQDIIKILLDSLHLKKVNIAGLSMGAAIAMDFIIAYPQMANKAIIISAGINGYEKTHPVDSISMEWYSHFTKALMGKDTVKAAAEFTKAWAEGIYRKKDSLKSPVSRFVYSKTLANLRMHKMEGWPSLQKNPPAMEKLINIRVPVLVIDGDKDLPYITTCSKYMAENIPGARRIIMKDVAHMLNLESLQI